MSKRWRWRATKSRWKKKKTLFDTLAVCVLSSLSSYPHILNAKNKIIIFHYFVRLLFYDSTSSFQLSSLHSFLGILGFWCNVCFVLFRFVHCFIFIIFLGFSLTSTVSLLDVSNWAYRTTLTHVCLKFTCILYVNMRTCVYYTIMLICGYSCGKNGNDDDFRSVHVYSCCLFCICFAPRFLNIAFKLCT